MVIVVRCGAGGGERGSTKTTQTDVAAVRLGRRACVRALRGSVAAGGRGAAGRSDFCVRSGSSAFCHYNTNAVGPWRTHASAPDAIHIHAAARRRACWLTERFASGKKSFRSFFFFPHRQYALRTRLICRFFFKFYSCFSILIMIQYRFARDPRLWRNTHDVSTRLVRGFPYKENFSARCRIVRFFARYHRSRGQVKIINGHIKTHFK